MRTNARTIFAGSVFLCTLTLLVLFCCSHGAYAALASSPWPMFHHDLAHTGVSPYHDAAPSDPWKCLVDTTVLSSCAIGTDGTIYVGGFGSLYAINGNGTLKWITSIGSTTRSSPAIADDGTIYIGSYNDRLYAIRADGSVKWSYLTAGDITSSPAIAPDGTVYVGSRDGKLYAINPDGTKKWSLTVGDVHMCSPAVGPDGTIYTGGGSYFLFAINPDGSPKWQYPTGDRTYAAPALSPDGSIVYSACCDMTLHAVNTSDGSGVWTFPVDLLNQYTSASPAVAPDGTIYIGSNYGVFHAISPAGVELWRYDAGSDIRSSAAISADGTIYFGDMNGFLHALNPDGSPKWHYLTRSSIYSSPAIDANGSVCVASWDGYVYGNLNHNPPLANPPTDLQATILSETSVRLDWADNSSDEFGFRIERKTGAGGTYSGVGTAPADATTFTNSYLTTGQTYYYRVAAYQEGGYSYSNEIEVVMPGLSAPSDLVATTISDTQIDLSWIDNSQAELGYKIERKAGNLGLFREIATVDSDFVSSNPCAYSDTSVNPAMDYYYRVRAYNLGSYSSYSDEAWAASGGMDYTEIMNGDIARPQVALTFDAGTSGVKYGVLALLRQYNVRCTFFSTGVIAQSTPGYWIEATNDGNQVCNHTYDHPPLPDITDEEIKNQLTMADEILYGITGNRSRPLFRAPYGSCDARVRSAAESIGYRHVFWSLDSGDIGAGTAQAIVNQVLNNITNGDVVLFHCTVANTETALQTILPELLSRGYELVTVSELAAPEEAVSPAGSVDAGWSLISFPIEPAHAAPLTVFKGGAIEYNLYRWEYETQSLIAYEQLSPGDFGPITADEGNWLYSSGPGTLKCWGRQQTTARHIMLPHTYSNPSSAWSIVGYPFETAQEWSNCSVYNPYASAPQTRSIADAMAAGWIYSVLYAWDPATQSMIDVGLPDDLPTSTQLDPWHGYWLFSMADDLQLIIPPAP